MSALKDSAEAVAKSFADLLAVMAEVDKRYYPPKEDRTPGWYSKFQVRCSGCGRFSSTLRSGDGYNSCDGTYDPWFEVDCKRCGVGDGYIHCD